MITNADTGVLLTYEAKPLPLLLARPAQPQPRDLPPPIYTTYGMAVVSGTSANAINTALPNQLGILVPGVQAQDGSFVGSYLDNSGQTDMVAFDGGGCCRWIVPNEQPSMATPDGFLGTSGRIYDSGGNVVTQLPSMPIQSWTGNAYQFSPLTHPIPQATPPYASAAGENRSGSGTSPLCHDERDQLIAEYGKYGVLDSSYPKPYPRFTPNCFQLTNMAHSQYFSFLQINIPGPRLPEFNYALIKNPLVVPASSGYGLDDWLLLYEQQYGVSRAINSGFRDPVQNQQGTPGAPTSRHMLGDAIDFNNVTRTPLELQNMNNTALKAGADFVETLASKTYCAASFRCAHADWRRHDRNKYAH